MFKYDLNLRCGFRFIVTNQKRSLTIDDLNPNLKKMKCAIRGPLERKVQEIQKELQSGKDKPFSETIKANIGDAHAMGQPPITFIRQTLSLISNPALLGDPDFPDDVKERGRAILKELGGSVGCYTNPAGLESIRKHVCDYIQHKHGGSSPLDWQNIVLSAGASEGITSILRLLSCPIDGKEPGVMIPIPTFPPFYAFISDSGMKPIPYFLNEEKGWMVEGLELERSFKDAQETCAPRALIIVNPNNPTGQVLPKESIEEIIKFAYTNKLFVLSDSVYEDNIYEETTKYYSIRKTSDELGEPYNKLEMAKIMSCSKGFMGECGIRGGYVQLTNMCPKVRAVYINSLALNGPPSVHGQVVVDCVFNPPKPGEPSYDLFTKEKNNILASLKSRAKLLSDTLNSFEGCTCVPVEGSMFAFPRIELPPKAIRAAEKENLTPDAFYVVKVLENTGVYVVPGSGFGQEPGTYHYRITILPRERQFGVMLKRLQKYHQHFMNEYR